jgi:hypothetical protein
MEGDFGEADPTMLAAVDAVLEINPVWWCKMMHREVPADDLIDGTCYWDQEDCEGGWSVIVPVKETP